MKLLKLLSFIILLSWSKLINAQWVQANTGLTVNDVNSFAVIGNNLFAGTGNISGNGQGVFLSTDNGATWAAVNNGLTNLNIRNIIAKDSTLYVAIGATTFPANGGIYKSTDLGNNWTAVNNGFGVAHAFRIAAMGTTLYASMGGGGNNVYISTDEGANWTVTTDPTLVDVQAKSIIDDGTNLILASDANSSGVFYSSDNGTTWVGPTLSGGADQVIALGNTVFAATGTGVFKSIDHGVTWSPTTNVAGVIDNAVSMAVIGSALVVGCPFSVYKTCDEGITWEDVSLGAGGSNLSIEQFGMDGINLYAGNTFHSVGLWKRPLSELNCLPSNITQVNEENSFNLYPNPSTGIFQLTLNELPSTKSSLEIYNALGENIYSILNLEKQHEINLSELAKGIYFVKILNNEKFYTKKIIIE